MEYKILWGLGALVIVSLLFWGYRAISTKKAKSHHKEHEPGTKRQY